MNLKSTRAAVFFSVGAGLCLTPSSSAHALANSVAELKLVVIDTKAPDRRWGADKITKGLKRELQGKVKEIISSAAIKKATKALKLDAKLTSSQALVRACRQLGAEYALVTKVSRKGWLYTARAVLINCNNGKLDMDFRAGFYKPSAEALDRGYRIGSRTLQKLAALIENRRSLVRTSPPKQTGTSTASKAESESPSAKTEATATGSDEGKTETTTSESSTEISSTEESAEGDDFGEDDFAAEFADTGSGESEFDGVSDEGGWIWQIRGWIGAKYFAFFDPDLPDYKDRHFAKLGFKSTLSGRLGPDFRLRVLPLFEVNLIDHSLHRTTVEEGFLEYALETVEFRVGWDSLTWGSASTIHVVDIVNARDFSEGVMDAPKVGQPMLATRFLFGMHSLTLLYMTPFLPPQMPRLDSPFSPFSPPPGVDPSGFRFGSKILYGSKYEEWQPQAAARISMAFSTIDLHASYFYGYARFPFVHLPTETAVYPLLQNVSGDFTWLIKGWSLKAELSWAQYFETARTRNPPLTLSNGQPAQAIPFPDPRWTWVLGIERTFDTFLGDTTFTPLAEFLGDSDSPWFTDDRPPDDLTRFFENHLVYGFRWDFQNDYDSKLTFSDIVDLRNLGDHLFTAEYEERWLQHFTFILGGRLGLAEEGSKASGNKQLTGMYTALRLSY